MCNVAAKNSLWFESATPHRTQSCLCTSIWYVYMVSYFCYCVDKRVCLPFPPLRFIYLLHITLISLFLTCFHVVRHVLCSTLPFTVYKHSARVSALRYPLLLVHRLQWSTKYILIHDTFLSNACIYMYYRIRWSFVSLS